MLCFDYIDWIKWIVYMMAIGTIPATLVVGYALIQRLIEYRRLQDKRLYTFVESYYWLCVLPVLLVGDVFPSPWWEQQDDPTWKNYVSIWYLLVLSWWFGAILQAIFMLLILRDEWHKKRYARPVR